MKKYLILTGLALGFTQGFAPAAWADNIAHCEVLLVQNVDNPELGGTMQISAYRPAASFISSVYDAHPAHQTHIEGHDIQALLCRRSVLIPSETDYPMMATGVPFVVSQNFDSAESDSLTMFWKDGAFDYVYKGSPLSAEAQSLLETRLAEFSTRKLQDDDSAVSEIQIEPAALKDADIILDSETDSRTQAQIEADLDAEIQALMLLNDSPPNNAEAK